MAWPKQRPLSLSDPHHDFTRERLAKLLAIPDDQLSWQDYQCLLGPFLPAGTYDESVYFLPLAFDYILSHDDSALDLITSIIWFTSEYADQLAKDHVSGSTQLLLIRCLDHWTSHFTIIHYDREACRKKGWRTEYVDLVANQEVVAQATCDLVRFIHHANLAEHFVRGIATSSNPIKAAWFLEYARSQFDVYKPPEHAPIQDLIHDREHLKRAAEIVRIELITKELSPTYWNDTFTALHL